MSLAFRKFPFKGLRKQVGKDGQVNCPLEGRKNPVAVIFGFPIYCYYNIPMEFQSRILQ